MIISHNTSATSHQSCQTGLITEIHSRLSKMLMLLSLLALTVNPAWGAVTDWGVVPVDQPTSFSFGANDITNNFTDQYNFSIQGGTSATAAVTVTFDPCKNGCGNPEITYGIYDAQGQLVSEIQGSGSITLAAGSYYLKVKGTGMGSGNSVDYSGTIYFSAAQVSPAYVSGAPEPADWLLMLSGSAFLAWAVRRRNPRPRMALRPCPSSSPS